MNVNYSEKNKTPQQIGGNALRAAAGLALYGIGVYLTIQANIGVAPWDCLFLGIRNHTVLSYDVTAEQMHDWARMMDIEFVHITKDTTVEDLEKELFLNDLAWKLK